MPTVFGRLKYVTDEVFDTAIVTFTPSSLLHAGDSETILPLSVSVETDDGYFSLDLPATDDPAFTPVGWHYRVHVRAGDYATSFVMLLPDQDEPVNLFEVPHAVPGSRVWAYVRTVNGQGPDAVGDVTVSGDGGPVGPVAWADVTGKPTAFVPASHTHPQSEVTGLASVLAGKETVGSAASALAGHVAASDPHPQYLTLAKASPEFDAQGAAQAVSDALSPVATSGLYSDLAGKPGLATVALSGSYTDLVSKPATFPPSAHTHAESEVTGLVADLASKANTASLAPVATTGVYSDLTGKPAIPDVSDTPRYVRFSVAWPARPAGSRLVIFVGGVVGPVDAVTGDVWIPAS